MAAKNHHFPNHMIKTVGQYCKVSLRDSHSQLQIVKATTRSSSENVPFPRSLWMLPGLRSILWCLTKPPVEQTGLPTTYSTPAMWQQQTCSRSRPCNEKLCTHITSIQGWRHKVCFTDFLAISMTVCGLTDLSKPGKHAMYKKNRRI